MRVRRTGINFHSRSTVLRGTTRYYLEVAQVRGKRGNMFKTRFRKRHEAVVTTWEGNARRRSVPLETLARHFNAKPRGQGKESDPMR
eukprot:scaffold16516_cov57-Phaeocystis_antarctica.AAC.2